VGTADDGIGELSLELLHGWALKEKIAEPQTRS
jgi:hypothetical protein